MKLHLGLEGSQGWRSCTRLPGIPRESGLDTASLGDKPTTASPSAGGTLCRWGSHTPEPNLSCFRHLLLLTAAGNEALEKQQRGCPSATPTTGTSSHPPPPATRGAPGRGTMHNTREQCPKQTSPSCSSDLITAAELPWTEGAPGQIQELGSPLSRAPLGSEPGFWWEQGQVISSSRYPDGQANKK